MWQSIIGHNATLAPLMRAVETGAIAQAYLFSGPQGVGKSLAAALFAARVVSHSPLPMEEGQGEGVGRVTNGHHPDAVWLRVLPDKSEISMEQWRAVEAKMQFQALEGDRKFIIIDDAERMSLSVANACLKALEEPPSKTHFILISHDADRLLPTIRSRCQQVVFSPLPQSVVKSWLVGRGVGTAVAERVAGLSQGSLQRAERLAKPEILAVVDAVFRDLQLGLTPHHILSHATALAALEEMPEVLDALAVQLRNHVVTAPGRHALNRIRAIEHTSRHLSVKGANKELLLNELFISLTVSS